MTNDPGPQWRYPGARWWKFDFHTHTPASSDYGKGREQASLSKLKPRDWLLNFMRAQVDCVAVTDHNSGEWVDPLKDALRELKNSEHPEYRPLTLFPGVEITANAGVHILALLDIDKGTSDVSALLGAVGYTGSWGKSDIAADSAPIKVVEAVSNAGGIPILAHVDGPAGAWRLTGNTLAPLLDSDGLFCMEVVEPNEPGHKLYLSRKLAWAEVLGSDSHHTDGADGQRFPGSHYTWVKMAQPSLEGLRLALLDGERFSIRRSDDKGPFDPFAVPKHHIESIEISDAKYMGRGNSAHIRLNPWFNAIVGGRGTGKSTVIHALRLASGRDHQLTELDDKSTVRLTFERFNQVPASRQDQGGLTDDTKAAWIVMRDGVRHRIQWKNGELPKVEEYMKDGNWKLAEVQTLVPDRFPLRLFSQGQISELAGESQRALLGVIDDAAGVAPFQTKFEDACKTFYATRARIREIDAKLSRRDQILLEKGDVERKLSAFEKGHSELLTVYRRRNRQKQESDRQLKEMAGAAEQIENLAENLQLDDLPTGVFLPESSEDQDALEILSKLSEVLNESRENLLLEARKIKQSVEKQRKALAYSTWKTALDDATRRYEELVAALQKQGIGDPSAHARLMQGRQRLEAEMQRLESEQKERQRLIEESENQMNQIVQARYEISDARTKFLSIALAKNKFVRIASQAYGNDMRVIEHSLREVLNIQDGRFQGDILGQASESKPTGAVAKLIECLPDDTDKRRIELEARIKKLKRRIEASCEGKGDFGGFFNNYLERKFKDSPEFLDKLLTWFPEDGLDVRYSRRGDGHDFQPIGHASAGQRSAAMLAFLLAHGDEPLILDQPEDDLDNHLIYKLVVRQIRENKIRRQIIVVTHNPNVVVNGDAEMLHAFHFENGQCAVALSGSLQDSKIRDEVCEIMEGGREAFAHRYKRLGSE